MNSKNPDQLHNIRHSLAHLLAAAVLQLFPNAKPTIGPPTDSGFYYDFDFGKTKISEEDLKEIQKKMRKLLPGWHEFERMNTNTEDAKKIFKDNEYKIELIDDLAKEGQDITLYKSGDFVDLCRGGHVEDMAKEVDGKAFKLSHIAGAYWRGDEKNTMLTRIYGLAFETPEELTAYEQQLVEAKKRDHRKLGKELGLFAFSDLVGKGLPMFLPKGNMLREELARFITKKKKSLEYQFVHIPHLARKELYERSGHMGKYDAMMPVMKDDEGQEFVMKAMNCPHHFELYNAEPHSYRDLPIRYAENTTVYRNEKSGELHGLTRVKSLTQDDTHHFLRHDQIKSEIEMVLSLMKEVYEKFDFTDYHVQISIRDPQNKEKYFGGDALWEESEKILIEAVKKWGAPYSVEEGEAAFYGPKIDIMVKDSIGRQWQLTTVQLDFNQSENFNLTYTGEDGKDHKVAILHVAILGSFERFLGILIEHYAGAFPFWLSPVQMVILPIAEAHQVFAEEVKAMLKETGVRVEMDESNETLGKRIRKAKTEKIPYIAVIGDKEVEAKSVTLESRDSGDSEALDLNRLMEKLKQSQ